LLKSGSKCPTIETPDDIVIGIRVLSERDIWSIAGLYKDKDMAPNTPKELFEKENDPSDIYHSSDSRTIKVVQQNFEGNSRDYDDIGLLYNDGDFNGDIDRIELVSEPSGDLELSDTKLGDFTYTFPSGSKSDSFTYRLVDKRGNKSSPVKVSLSTDVDEVSTPVRSTKRLSIPRFGVGKVTSRPSGINCGGREENQGLACNEDYETNSSVTLTAVRGEGYEFAGWTG